MPIAYFETIKLTALKNVLLLETAVTVSFLLLGTLRSPLYKLMGIKQMTFFLVLWSTQKNNTLWASHIQHLSCSALKRLSPYKSNLTYLFCTDRAEQCASRISAKSGRNKKYQCFGIKVNEHTGVACSLHIYLSI